MASAAGLAPARTGLKGRVLGLLCIHGRNAELGDWSDGVPGDGEVIGTKTSSLRHSIIPSPRLFQRRRPRVLYVNTGRSVAITWIKPAFTNASMTDSTGLYAIGASS